MRTPLPDTDRMVRSRFAALTQVQAIAVGVALVFAMVASIAGLSLAVPNPATAGPNAPLDHGDDTAANKNHDLVLYTAIVTSVARGQNYYNAAADAHRQGNYPLKPFIAVRLPTLAVVGATLGTVAMTVILYALVLATLLVWRQRLTTSFDDPGRRLSALGLLLAGMLVAFWPEFVVLHELWAGILLALALGLHRPDRWLPSVVIAACALFIRELSLPFILLMGAFAVFERRWREAGTIAVVVGIFALVMAIHARNVAGIVQATDLSSPGWVRFGGWSAFVHTLQMPSALRVFPTALASSVILLSMFGWLSWRSRTGLFGTLVFAGYGLFFMAMGRPDNFYWGFVVVPTLLIGLSFLPRGFADLRAAIAPARSKLDFMVS